MKNLRRVLVLCGLFIGFQVFAFAESITLQEAVKSGKVQIQVKGNGGFRGKCLNLKIKNNTPTSQNIVIPAGQIFRCSDDGAQNLINTSETMLILASNASKALDLLTMCIEAHDYSPSKGVGFELSKMATGGLLKLMNLISEHGYQVSTAQSAVWSITNGYPIREIYSLDVDMATELAKIVSESTGQPMPKVISPEPHYIISIKAGFQFHAPKKMNGLTLAVFDEAGNKKTSFYENRNLQKGLHEYSVGVNMIGKEGSKYFIRILNKNNDVLFEKLVDESTDYQKPKAIHTSMDLQYDAKKSYQNAVLAVYNEKGKLIEDLARKNIKAGGRYQHKATFRHNQPAGTKLFYRLTSPDRKVIAEKMYVISENDAKNSGNTLKQLSIPFSFRAPKKLENASLRVYDSEGKVMRTIFEKKSYPEGGGASIKFSIRHQQGSGAKFYARLKNGDGEIIKEKEIVSP